MKLAEITRTNIEVHVFSVFKQTSPGGVVDIRFSVPNHTAAQLGKLIDVYKDDIERLLGSVAGGEVSIIDTERCADEVKLCQGSCEPIVSRIVSPWSSFVSIDLTLDRCDASYTPYINISPVPNPAVSIERSERLIPIMPLWGWVLIIVVGLIAVAALVALFCKNRSDSGETCNAQENNPVPQNGEGEGDHCLKTPKVDSPRENGVQNQNSSNNHQYAPVNSPRRFPSASSSLSSLTQSDHQPTEHSNLVVHTKCVGSED